MTKHSEVKFKRAHKPSQRHNQPPRLNGKHSVTIRMGATAHDIMLDGDRLDLSRRYNETHKEHAERIERTSKDLIGMVFG